MVHQFTEYYEIDRAKVADIMSYKINKQLERIENEK